MQEIHTHTFVGGPKDGQREHIQGADVNRGSVTVRSVPPNPLVKAVSGNTPTMLPATDTLYERTAYEGEKCRFIFWKAQGLSIDEAFTKLFAHYIDR